MASETANGGGDVDDFGIVDAEDNFLWIVALSRGEHGNYIRVALFDKDTYDGYVKDVETGPSLTTATAWQPSATVGRIDTNIEDEKSFLLVVQAIDQGMVPETISPSGSYWVTKEMFNVSIDEAAVTDMGVKRFVETMVNSQSQYIRVSMNSAYRNNDSISIDTQSWIQLAEGSDGEWASDEDSACIDAYDLYQNPEEIDVNLFIDSNKGIEVKKRLDIICQDRKDAMAILDVPMTTVVGNRGNETLDLRAYVRGEDEDSFDINSSYSAIYGNWLEVYDKWNGKYRWVPASGYVAGLYANNDSVSEPWFAPAGPNRTIITGVRRLAWNPSLSSRDVLYKNNINPIVSLAGQGKMIYGQKTLLAKESAFNRVNVRRLFIVLEKAISTAAKYFLFEPNDDISRLLLINTIDPFMRDVKARRGIYDYRLVCDATNNTDVRIEGGELWCDLYIAPTRAAEFIVLNFVATKTGAVFTELSGVVGS